MVAMYLIRFVLYVQLTRAGCVRVPDSGYCHSASQVVLHGLSEFRNSDSMDASSGHHLLVSDWRCERVEFVGLSVQARKKRTDDIPLHPKLAVDKCKSLLAVTFQRAVAWRANTQHLAAPQQRRASLVLTPDGEDSDLGRLA